MFIHPIEISSLTFTLDIPAGGGCLEGRKTGPSDAFTYFTLLWYFLRYKKNYISFPPLASAVPTKRDSELWDHQPTGPHANITDVDILNFALTLELLRSAFYTNILGSISPLNFTDRGFNTSVRGFYDQIAQHELTYVTNLTTILGNQSVQACSYNFGTPNATQFVATSDMLEAIATSAYIGSSVYIKNKTLRAHQSTWVNNGVRGGNPWSTAYETPLDLNQVFTLISPLISNCPKNNTAIPVKANPQLIANPANALPGQNVTLSYSGQPSDGTGLFVAFLNGIPPTFIPLDRNFTVIIPITLRGFAYVVITNNSTVADDSTTVAGPAFFEFPFNSNNTIISLGL
ncbi:ferritin-like domain-containing protein [Multifurca ochricompacta]|uniref:Ferritin-like domain-containing protein n=1 Tax=Multifurca ochricompacta TaxID=376703 RepID=A0AAD4QIP4_9AGAM|nr:ferritin-like domain-containing protein [Multifurca ochricompacta]